MRCFKVLLFFSAIAVAYVTTTKTPGKIFGADQQGTEKLVEKQQYVTAGKIVKFNNSGTHDITIDKVEFKFESGKANLKILSGGPDNKFLNIQVTPISEAGEQLRTTVVIYGRVNSGEKKNIRPSDVVFE